MEKMDILTFAKVVMRKHLYDYEVGILTTYEERMQCASFYEWIRPKRRESQHLMNIWLTYQEYLNDTLVSDQMMAYDGMLMERR